MSRFQDLTGLKFNKLTVIERAEDHITKNGVPYVMWKCKCECGKYKITYHHALLSNSVKSCGCLKLEMAKMIGKNNKRYNEYDIETYDYAVGYTSSNKQFILDKDDIPKIKQYCWHINKSGYVVTNHEDENRLHRFIIDCPSWMVVDHINGNQLDNRRCNLRICTIQENSFNTKLNSNSKSGYKGVSWNKLTNTWESYVMYDRKKINLGYYAKLEDAVSARREKELELFGQFSAINSRNDI